ncbi:hypothetical protein Fcan01_28563 [Folsomia candida]|uniref:Ionotropic glutamate receptor C-terminal domain-containing protein n=1 Tax=Folsomia candida TaxID=158441 RepID=A0A226CUM8_FOLCA|nr:hypothetical protein Fcan01_28563 [Folsomia candida]
MDDRGSGGASPLPVLAQPTSGKTIVKSTVLEESTMSALQQKYSKCNPISRKLGVQLDSSSCVHLAVGIKYNYTSQISRSYKRMFELPNNIYFTNNFLVFQAQQVASLGIRGSILLHGATYERFQMATVASYRVPMRFETLLMPIDKETWVFSGISLFLVNCTFVAFTFRGKKVEFRLKFMKSLLTNLTGKLFWTTSALMGHVENGCVEFRNYARQLSFWLITWQLFSFFLGLVYSGGLYSFLAAVCPPTLPTTLNGILTERIPIYSTHVVRSTSGYESGVEAGVRNVLIDGDLSKLRKKELSKLASTTKVLEINPIDAAKSICQGERISSSHGMGNYLVDPTVYVMSDFEERLDSFLASVSIFRKTAYIRKIEEITALSEQVVWSGDKSFIILLYENILKRLEHSGIYNKWLKGVRTGTFLWIAENIVTARDFKMLLAKAMFGLTREIVFVENETVSIESVRYAFAFCAKHQVQVHESVKKFNITQTICLVFLFLTATIYLPRWSDPDTPTSPFPTPPSGNCQLWTSCPPPA